MNTDQITQWLRSNGHDREWLAEQIGCTYGSLNQWFSRARRGKDGFPDWAAKAIERLMNPPGSESGGLEVVFTAREFERIEEARKLIGLGSRKLFYEAAIREKTDAILARGEQTLRSRKNPLNKNSDASATTQIALLNEDTAPTNIESMPPREDTSYESGKKKPRKKNGTED